MKLDKLFFGGLLKTRRRPQAGGAETEPVSSREGSSKDRVELGAASGKKVGKPRRDWRSTAKRVTLGVLLAANLAQMAGPAVHLAYNQVQQKPQAVERLLEHDHDLSAEQKSKVQGEVFKMDGEVLAYLADQKVSMTITQTDREVVDWTHQHGFQQRVSVTQLVQEANKANEVGDEIQNNGYLKTLRDSSREVRQRQMELTGSSGMMMGGMGMMGGGLMGGGMFVPTGSMVGDSTQAQASQVSTEMAQLAQEQMGLQQQKDLTFNSIVESHGLSDGWGGYSNAPVSVDFLVKTSGARTPQEIAEYKSLLEIANGDRLQQAQDSALARLEKSLETAPDQSKEFMQQHVEALKKNPDALMLDRQEFGIMVPDVRYARVDDDGPAITVRRNDFSPESQVDALGLHLPGTGQVQVDHDALGRDDIHVAVHELGHALESSLKENSPKFYEGWSKRLNSAFEVARETAKQGGGLNSEYGLTKPAEYVAEGVEAFYRDPDHLKENDPMLYQLTAELVQHGSEQAKSSVKRDLLSMAAGAVGFGVTALGVSRMMSEDKRARSQDKPPVPRQT